MRSERKSCSNAAQMNRNTQGHACDAVNTNRLDLERHLEIVVKRRTATSRRCETKHLSIPDTATKFSHVPCPGLC